MSAPTTTTDPAPEAETTAPLPDRLGQWGVVGPGLAVGAVCALVGLDRSSLWRDEAYSLGAVHQMETTLRETRGTMGAYYLLLRVWTTVSDSAWWMRSLSVVLALAALVVVVRLVARAADARTARWAGVLLGLSLLWVAYAQEARSYALVLLLTATSWMAVDHVLTDHGPERRRWVVVHVATAVVLPLAQGLAVLQLAAQAAALLAGRADRRTWRAIAPGLAASLAVTGALTAVGTGEAGTWIAPVDGTQLRTLAESLTSEVPIFLVLLAGLAVVGAVLCARRTRDGDDEVARIRAAAPVAWAVVPPALLLAISLLGRPTLVPRYVMASAAGVAVLWAVAVRALDGRRGAARAPLVGVAVVALLVVGQVRLHDTTGDDWRLTARALAAEPKDGDVILLATSEIRPPFEAAWVELDSAPIMTVVNSPRPLGRVLRIEEVGLSDAEAVDAAQARHRVWVVGEERDPLRADAVDELIDAGFRSERTIATEGGVPAELLVRS
ncbi:MAG TPA: hypothetical protein VF228_00795 [Iamia sp.]